MTVMAEALIHPSAVVAPGAELAADVTVGPGAVIEDDVVIGAGCKIDSCAKIASGARLGKNVKVAHGAAVGTEPQDLKFAGEKTILTVGDNTNIREYATLNRGTRETNQTLIGKNCLLMAYSHVAHDCVIGDNVILSNVVQLGGHVEIGDYAILGGVTAVHQFAKIGRHVMVGGGLRVAKDLCPFSLAAGEPIRIASLNKVGLKRRDFSVEEIETLGAVFKLLFFSDLNTTQALERIRLEVEQIPSVEEILEFVGHTERGLTK